MTKCFVIIYSILLSSSLLSWEDSNKVYLSLPTHIYGTVGTPLNLYYEGVTLNNNLDRFVFEVECEVGSYNSTKWSYCPELGGTYNFVIKVYLNNKLIESDTSTIIVSKTNFTVNDTIRFLMIGASITEAGLYAYKLVDYLNSTAIIKTYGSKFTNNVFLEGHAGKTWKWFYTKSPFVFDGKFDYAKYINSICDGYNPNIITLQLGINDVFSLNPDNVTKINKELDSLVYYSKSIIKEFKQFTPDAKIGIFLIPSPNKNEDAFYLNYKGLQSRSGWKKIRHLLNERYRREFQVDLLIPIFVDEISGYPADNALHPNLYGASEIAANVLGWLNFKRRTLDTLPIQLSSLSVEYYDRKVFLNWVTSVELNNRIFEIQRRELDYPNSDWESIGFLNGSPNSSEKKLYTFVDSNIKSSLIEYRIKQIDLDGSSSYSEIRTIRTFIRNTCLYQNYPNPVNPSTTISYAISQAAFINLKIFDALGKEICTLVHEEKPAGLHEVKFNSKSLPSGVYFYEINTSDYCDRKKLLIIK